MKNLALRTLTGSLYITVILLAILIDPIGLELLVFGFNLMALLEFNRIIRRFDIQPAPGWIPINILLTGSVLVLMQIEKAGAFVFIPLLLYILAIYTVSLFQNKGNPVLTASVSVSGGMIISLPLVLLNMVHAIALRESVPFTLALFIFIWTKK